MKIAFLIILFSWYTEQVNDQRHDFSISGLLKEQSLIINFNSKGCFNNDKYEIHLIPTNNIYSDDSSAAIIIYDVSDSNHKKISNYFIAKYHIISLDGWLQYYRTSPGGECTTTDEIEFIWKERNDTIYTEKYYDGSCLSAMNTNYIFSIWEILNIGINCKNKKAIKKYKKKKIIFDNRK